VPLSGGTTYWLILQNGVTAGNVGDTSTYWDQSDGASSAYHPAVGAHSPCGSPDVGACSEMFQLSDTAIPEPDSWTLLGGGIVLMGFFTCRRR